MQRIPVASSNIASIGYDSAEGTLEIEFTTGAVYAYYRVPYETYDNLMSATSHGKYFATYIKNRFTFSRIG